MKHQAKKSLGLKTVNSFTRAKKALGQNFLKSNLALKKIIEAGEISPNDIILEIGPGKGILTEKLLEKAKLVIAVEKDRNLFQLLQEKFSKEIQNNPTSQNGRGKLILIEEDILKFNIAEFAVNYKIIANIPYNITGTILKKFLTEKNQPSMMVLMVQNEVAKRIVANDKKESILSISIKAYGEPKIIMKVPARYFSPAPKVDSAIIVIKNISRKIFAENKINEGHALMDGTWHDSAESKNFWKIIHAGFSHKRKKLSNNLKNIIKNIPEEYKDKRAENLSLLDWINIAKE
jgi:16S rRNA (adenine1518-N6/adenine1519-N6)-dimethyltransferase